jgi:hypothetical protein
LAPTLHSPDRPTLQQNSPDLQYSARYSLGPTPSFGRPTSSQYSPGHSSYSRYSPRRHTSRHSPEHQSSRYSPEAHSSRHRYSPSRRQRSRSRSPIICHSCEYKEDTIRQLKAK